MGRATAVEIIGVVNDIRQVAMAEPAQPTIYLHNLQNSRSKTTIVARTQGEPLEMADDIRRAIWSLDSEQAITAVFTFDEAVSRALAGPRLLVVLLTSFGLVGLALEAVGVYGITVRRCERTARRLACAWHWEPRPAACRRWWCAGDSR